jgi:hypothetical protein
MTVAEFFTYAAVACVVSLGFVIWAAATLPKRARRFARKHPFIAGLVTGRFSVGWAQRQRGRAPARPPLAAPPAQPKLSKPTTLYRYYDANHKLLYVGITCRGARRAEEHAKSQPWWPRQAWMRSVHYDTWVEAEEAERLAIAAEKPECNKQKWKPRERKAS